MACFRSRTSLRKFPQRTASPAVDDAFVDIGFGNFAYGFLTREFHSRLSDPLCNPSARTSTHPHHQLLLSEGGTWKAPVSASDKKQIVARKLSRSLATGSGLQKTRKEDTDQLPFETLLKEEWLARVVLKISTDSNWLAG